MEFPNILHLVAHKKIALGVLLAVSIVVHFAFFGHPDRVVFDEVHFGKFISGYYTHEYYFDIHPPLGKLVIAGFAKLFDFKPEFSFAEIGEQFPDGKYKALRFLPSLAGTLLALIVYLLALELGISRLGSFAAGMLVIFDNALLTQSRFILLDAFLLLSGFFALWCYFKYRNTHRWTYLIGTGLGAAIAISIKWTGLTFLAVPVILELFELGRTRRITHMFQKCLTLAVLPAMIYLGVFWVHFQLLYKSGAGDAFMSRGFQAGLQGSEQTLGPGEQVPSFLEKVVELNAEMYSSNQRLTADHPYGSSWYTWPLMQRPVFYWVQEQARIYLIGNPVIWWITSMGVVYLMLSFVTDKKYRTPTAVVLLLGYVLNILPFVGIKRVMFLYHYLTALIFAILMLIYVLDREEGSRKYLGLLIAAAAVGFLFFAPLSYGLSLPDSMYQLRTWLPTWE